jgi:hypothetical protein
MRQPPPRGPSRVVSRDRHRGAGVSMMRFVAILGPLDLRAFDAEAPCQIFV